MDKTVPAGAAILLDFIGDTETGRKAPEAYTVIYGHKQTKLLRPLTQMTLDEVVAAQANWSRHHGSSAAGRYQFMRATLRGLMSELGLRGAQVLDANLQDRLAYHLLKRRGYEAWRKGEISDTEFGKRLAQEWASLPVLAPTKGAHRNLTRGQSYYAGDGLNRSLTKPEDVEQVLDRARRADKHIPTPPPIDKPAPTPAPAQAGINWIAVLIVAAVIAAALFLIRF